jgi:hypothetical protein
MYTGFFIKYYEYYGDKMRKMRWTGNVVSMEMRNVYRILFRAPEGRKPLGRPRCRWEYNIKMVIVDIRCEGVNWIQDTEDNVQWEVLVNIIINLQVPYKTGNVLTR